MAEKMKEVSIAKQRMLSSKRLASMYPLKMAKRLISSLAEQLNLT
jgi:hypothetical protein